MFLWIVFITIAVNLFAIFMYRKKGKEKIGTLFIIQAVSIGIIYGLILPPFTVSDEITHFMNGYHVANVIQNKGDVKLEKTLNNFSVYEMRIRDNDMIFFEGTEFIYDYSPEIVKSIDFSHIDLFEKESCYVVKEQILTRYFPFPEYSLMGIVIAIGRILCLSPFALVWLVRFANMIAYALICALALKVTPICKYLFYLVMLLPIGMYNICSTSYHTLLFAETFLLFAYIFYLQHKGCYISILECMLLLLLLVIIAPAKGVFLFYFVLCFLIPKDRFKSKKEYYIFISSAVIASLVSWLGYNLYSYSVVDSINETANFNTDDSQTALVGIDAIFTVLVTFIRNICKTILVRGFYIDRSISQIKFDTGSFSNCLSLYAFFVTAFFAEPEVTYRYTKKDKLVVASSYFLSYLLLSFVGYLAMVTAKKTDLIELKSIYCYQYLPLVGFLIKTNNKLQWSSQKYFLFVSSMVLAIHSAIFLNVAFSAGIL